MSSTFVADTPEDTSADNTHVIIIVNDDSGNISEVDQEMLQQLMISQENATLSVVRVDDESGENNTDVNLTVFTTPTKNTQANQNTERNGEVSTENISDESNGIVISRPENDGNGKGSIITQEPQVKTVDQHQGLEVPDPLLALDQEEIEKIEHALQSEQARQLLLSGILGQGTEAEAVLDDLLDPDLTGVPDDNEVVATISLDHCYSAIEGPSSQTGRRSVSSDFESSDSTAVTSASGLTKGGTSRGSSPKRRSQRQIDRMELEQLRKIRAENQEMLKKEKQEMVKLTPAKKENVDSEGEMTSSDASQPQPASGKKIEGSSGYRITTLRQEVQAKVLAFEPTTPTKTKSNATPLHSTSPTAVRNSQDSSTIVPRTPDEDSTNSKSVAKPRADSALTNSGGTGGVARPRRENRQPPKHLREAFVQLEEEGVISVLKSVPKALSDTYPDEEATPPASKVKLAKKPVQHENHQPVEAEIETAEDENVEEGAGRDDDDQSDSGDSWNSEDDPDRLWCLCRKPHNNQFMICCDKCSDWFHGRCVGVSRSMARALEEGGLEWICPKCVRQEQGLESPPPPQKEEKPVKAKEGSDTAEPKTPKGTQKAVKVQGKRSSISEKPKGPSGTAEAVEPPRKCVLVLCKNEARPSSIYCSEACIATHARESLLLISKEKSKMEKPAESTTPTITTAGGKPEPGKLKESVEFGKLMSQATPQSSKSKSINQLRKSTSLDGSFKPANLTDDTPVPVMDRKSGKTLTGSAAPKVGSLEQWLKDNPTFEVIKPTSSSTSAKTGPKTPLKSPTQTTPRNNSTNQISSTTPVPTIGSMSKTPNSTAASSPSQSSSASSSSVHTPKSATKTLSRSNSASTDPKSGHIRKKSTDSSKVDDERKVPDAESTRSSAKTSLKDALWNRCKEAADVQVTENEVEQFAEDIEQSLFRLFNKDVGVKYKARYRSLIFNIKDPKNQGLFRKIIERQVTPGQLVKMTAEELASQELTEWREREAKHQLEIIQKTEMELMNMSTKYLVKTHKGEEIIEETVERKKSEEREIVSTAIAPGMEISSLQDTTSKHGSHEFDLNCQICRKLKEDEVAPPSGSSHSRDGVSHKKKKDEKDRGKKSNNSSSSKNHSSGRKDSSSSSRSKDSSSSKGHDKSKEKDRDHSKEKERDHGKSKDKDHGRAKDKERERERPKEKEKEKDKDKKHHKHRSDKKEKNEKEAITTDSKPESTTVVSNPITDPVISTSSQIGDVVSSPTSLRAEPDDASMPVPSQSQQDQEVEAKKSPAEKEVSASKEEENSKQEPTSTTSTVSIRTPEEDSAAKAAGPPIPGCIWKGIINSSETGKFFVQAIDMKSSADLSDVEMPGSLDIVGRIRPEMVWDYVNQTRKAGSRDIVVVKFSPGSELSDKKNYAAFLSHMYKCNRYAVVGPISKMIKDFYIVPLPKDSPIPLSLTSMSLDIAGLDEARVNVLLGVVVRAKRKRAADGSYIAKSKVAKTAASASASASNGGSRSFTPPLPGTSSSSSPSVNYIPTARSATKRKESAADHKAADAKRRARSSDATPVDPTSTDDGADDVPYSPGQLLESEETDIVSAGPKQIEKALEELNRKIEEERKQLASLSAASAEDGVVIPGLDGTVVIPGLESDSILPPPDLEMSRFQSAPLTTPPVSTSTATSSSGGLNQISIPTNLQEILSTIQKKETELKKSVGAMESLEHGNTPNRNRFSTDSPMRMDVPSSEQDVRPVQDLFPPQDVDMRIAVPLAIPPAEDVQATLGRDPRKPASPPRPSGGEKKSLHQLTDAEVVAKAMEELGATAPVPIAPPQGQPPFFGSPPHNAAMPPMMMPGPPGMPGPGPMPPFHHPGGGPPMGTIPGPMGPYHHPARPPFMGGPPPPGHHHQQHHPPFHSPPSGGYRPKKKR